MASILLLRYYGFNTPALISLVKPILTTVIMGFFNLTQVLLPWFLFN